MSVWVYAHANRGRKTRKGKLGKENKKRTTSKGQEGKDKTERTRRTIGPTADKEHRTREGEEDSRRTIGQDERKTDLCDIGP